MDELFHLIEDMQIVLRGRKGVYKQAKAYQRAGKLYAQYGGGYIRLLASHGTSNPDVQWEHISDHPCVKPDKLYIGFVPALEHEAIYQGA